jgi:hypothetical protein
VSKASQRKASERLSDRRLELLQRVASQRQDLRDHARGIQAALGSLAGGLSPARWLGASPLVLAAGAILTLVLGRGRVLRTLGTGAAMLGLLRRYRSAFQLAGQVVSELAGSQSVRRSR